MIRSIVLAIVFICVTLIFLSACKSKKLQHANTDKTDTAIVKMIMKPSNTELFLKEYYADSSIIPYVKMQAEIQYKGADESMDLNAKIISEEGKYTWIRITAILGIEAARIKFEPQYVRILDHLHRSYIIASYDYFSQMAGVPLQFEQIQKLLRSQLLFKPNAISSTLKDNLLISTFNDHSLIQKASFNALAKTLKTLDIVDTKKNRTLKISYRGNTEEQRHFLPESIILNVLAEKNTDCNINLSNFVFEKKDEAPFQVPASYKEVHY